MIKESLLGLLLAIASGASVHAQSGGSDTTGEAAPARGTGLLNERNLAPTGKTLPHPGVSQGAPTSDLDRRIEQQDDKLDQSICGNCN